jgi:hypothetical protein
MSNYSGKSILLSAAIGFVLGAFLTAMSQPIFYASIPKDKAEMAKQIEHLNSRIEDQLQTINNESARIAALNDEIETEKKAATNAQQQVAAARKEAEDAKSAIPHRYEVVKEGARTFRLDTATGKTCLLFATEADWKKPEISAQNCEYEH